MATQTGQLNETDYFIWNPTGSSFSVEVHPDVMDGIARDVLESLDALPPRGAEVGGLLLGSVAEAQDGAIIRIERYHRIPCSHAAGPEFALDEADRAGLEKSAAAILEGGELSAVGLYRSHMRPGLQLENSDLELTDRYLLEPFDLVLLIKPETAREMSGRFFVRGQKDGSNNEMQPAGPAFPYRFDQGRSFAPPTLRSRRLVPDFIPDLVEPSHVRAEPSHAHEPEPEPWLGGLKKWWPLPAALLLAGGALWMLLSPAGPHDVATVPPAAKTIEDKTEAARPLGLYAAQAGQTWRVSWNPNATALHDARSVQLFVREGDEQSRIELSAQDLASGTYEYKPVGNDVTFRLEVTENSGRIAAESFHFVREVPAPVSPQVAAPPAAAAPHVPHVPHVTGPRAIHRVPPTVPASIRPRIKGVIPVDVRVRVDARGRVVSATLAGKHRAGLESYLADRALEAAKSWRFEPARENGKPVPGEQTIRFTFGK